MLDIPRVLQRKGRGSNDLIRTIVHHEYNFPEGIDAFSSKHGMSAPMPCGGIVCTITLAGVESRQLCTGVPRS